MPRVKANPDELLILELRITPPDGKPIEDWKITETDFKQVIAGREGGTPECRLHYHLYVECLRSRTWLIKWIYSIAHCENGEQGNSVFFTRKPHDNTLGYVVKRGDVVVRHGCTQTFIDEWLAKSDEYCRSRDAGKKRKQRLEKAFTQEVRERIEDTLKEHKSQHLRNPKEVLSLILIEYHKAGKNFPNRTTVETMIITVLYPYDASMAGAFYLKSFDGSY